MYKNLEVVVKIMYIDKNSMISKILGQSVSPDSLVGSITKWVGLGIIEGQLRPGDDLNSVELSKKFNTSRTPVREALMLLEKEGLVEIPPRRRPHVKKISLKEVREIYQVRASLKVLVSELIVKAASLEEIRSLQTYQQPLVKAAATGDVDAYFWGNVNFRNAETEISGNLELKRILDSLGLRTLQLRHLSLSLPNRMQQSLADHERLLQAYEDRDTILAMSLTRSIVLRGLDAIERSGWTGFQ